MNECVGDIVKSGTRVHKGRRGWEMFRRIGIAEGQAPLDVYIHSGNDSMIDHGRHLLV